MGSDKSAKKEKKAKRESTGGGDDGIPEVKAEYLAPIASPLADDKLSKKVYKLVKKSAKEKKVKRGVKECIKAIRKKQTGIMVIAGNISPIDVVTPIPVLCEDNDIPYVFVSSKEALGQAGSTKRPTSCMLILKGGDEDYDEVLKKVKSVQVAY